MTVPNNSHYYESGMSRRESLKWLGILAAGSTMATLSGCSKATDIVAGATGHWPDLDLPAALFSGRREELGGHQAGRVFKLGGVFVGIVLVGNHPRSL